MLFSRRKTNSVSGITLLMLLLCLCGYIAIPGGFWLRRLQINKVPIGHQAAIVPPVLIDPKDSLGIDEAELQDGNVVHILTSLDEDMLVGLPVLINSVLANAKMSVQFHIIWCADNASVVQQYLSCFDITGLDLTQIDVAEHVRQYMTPVFWSYLKLTQKTHKALGKCANILRLQAHKIFPNLDKVLWLDIDMVVQGDVGELWNLTLHDEWIMSAKRETVSENASTYIMSLRKSTLSRKTLDLYKERHGKPLNEQSYAFNNAVSLLNLKKWRSEDKYLREEYTFWMTMASKLTKYRGRKWWFMSSQSIMWFTYKEEVSFIPVKGWHCDGLGWSMRDKVSLEMAENAKLLHWNGDEKPWINSSRVHYPLWSKYKPSICNGTGACTRIKNGVNGIFYKCNAK